MSLSSSLTIHFLFCRTLVASAFSSSMYPTNPACTRQPNQITTKNIWLVSTIYLFTWKIRRSKSAYWRSTLVTCSRLQGLLSFLRLHLCHRLPLPTMTVVLLPADYRWWLLDVHSRTNILDVFLCVCNQACVCVSSPLRKCAPLKLNCDFQNNKWKE